MIHDVAETKPSLESPSTPTPFTPTPRTTPFLIRTTDGKEFDRLQKNIEETLGQCRTVPFLTNNIPARETALSAWLRKSHRNPGFRSDYIKIRLQHEASWPPVSKALIPSIKAIATITPYSRTELRQFSVVRKNDVNCVDFTLPVIFHTVEVAINGLWWLVGKGWTNDMRLFLMQKLLFLDHAWTTEH